jgi:alpha-1,4-digalacturonate transport system permease protein
MKKLNKILRCTILLLLVFLFLFPILWTVMSTFKSSEELYSSTLTFFPKVFTLENYKLAFSKGNFGLYFWNTTFVAIVGTILTVVINTMAGYALAKYKFKGSQVFLILFISTLMIPLEVIMNPIFTVITNFGLYNSLWGLIIPAAATPTGVFLMRQYLLTIPDDIIHSARIDGASELRIFLSIIVPIAKPAIAALAIFSFMWRWNDFLWPLIVTTDPKKYTVQLAISNFSGEFTVDWNSLLSMSTIAMIPVIIIFIIFQKHFVKGLATSGMKD